MSESEYWKKFMAKRYSRRSLVRGGAVLAAGLAAGSTVGCGGSTSPTPTTAAKAGTTPQTAASPAAGTTARAASTPAAAAATKIQRGGKLRYSLTLDASSLDVHVGNSGGDHYYWYAMFDNLIGYDQNFVSKPELSLAEKWDFSDPKVMVFYLRKGVTFHDGTPFNAQAVKFNIERVLDPATKAPNRAEATVIDRVEVVDDYTVKFHLKNPSAALIALLGDRVGAMQSPTAIQKYGADYGIHPVGTGPFQFVEWVKGSYVSMKRNEKYWGKDKDGNQLPYLDEVKVSCIPDSTVSFASLQTGDLDVTFVTAQDLAKAKANNKLGIQDFDGSGVQQVVVINAAKPPLDDLNLRLAVAYAINPEVSNKTVFFGDAIVAKAGMWTPGTWVYNESVPRPTYDVKKAKDFLAKAGKPNGFSASMVVWNDPNLIQTAEVTKAQLAEVGINVSIEVRDVSQATSGMFVDQAFNMYSTSWPRRPEPDSVASRAWKSDSYYNPGKLKNDKLDELIVKGASTYDIEERKKIYNQVNEIITADATWLVELYTRAHAGYNLKVQNMSTFFGGEAVPRYKELWLKQ